MSDTTTRLRAEIADLEKELASLEALAQPQRANATDLARQHRRGEATAAKLKDAVAARDAIEYALKQTKADLEEARTALQEAESAAADEVLLAEIAAGTVDYREAEREHTELLLAAERTVARAIARSLELSAAASAAKTRAGDAALRLAEKHGVTKPEIFARAVNGSEVSPLTGQDHLTKWPYGNRQTYKLISQVKNRTLGVDTNA